MCLAHQIDAMKAEAFGEELVGMLNGGALALMTSIGHRTGLFDAMEKLPPSTSSEIAEASGLQERYVREWLGAMAAGGVVSVDSEPENPRFTLPAEHAACLTRSAGADNFGVFAQYMAVLGGVEDRIVSCFHQGGGVPYAEFTRFHEVMAEDSGQSVLSSLFDKILPLVPGLIERLDSGIEVLDIGCGMGRALIQMARAFPNSRFTGYDLSPEVVNTANRRVREFGLTNIVFESKDLTTFDATAEPERFDLVTAFDAIHDQARPDRVLAGIAKTLKSDGDFLMQDIAGSSDVRQNLDHPIGAFLYTISTMHCMTVSLAQGGMGLGTMWGRETATAMLQEAGFGQIEIQMLDHDIQNDYYVIRKA